jgi:hypothetical protein
MNLANKVEYIATDPQRQVIPWVRLTGSNGVATEFRIKDFKDDPSKHEIRTMDCLDCHNRPAHRFRSPNDAVDAALAAGRIDAGIPWVKPQRRGGIDCALLYRARGGSEDIGVIALLLHELAENRTARGGSTADLPTQLFSRDESGLAGLSGQHQPQGLGWLLPLPRRATQKR